MGQGFVGLALLIASTSLVLLSVWLSVKRIQSDASRMPAVGWILIAFAAGLIGKLVESQVGVARVSDLAMTFALAGGLIAIAEIINSNVPDNESEEQSTKIGFAMSARTMYRATIAGALISTVLVVWLFVGWDMRRLSASLDITFAPRQADGSVALSGLTEAQEAAPERRIFTIQLANLYFIGAQNAWDDNRADDARNLALNARELLVEYERQDPYERNTQFSLAKTSSTLVDWGFVEYTDEMRDRYLRLASLFRTYPSLVSTSATAMARVGDNAMAIELAERAIATEESTKPWAVAWYAKGVALINLGEFDQAIESLNTAIEKEPKSASARLAHSALAFIYKQLGETELFELHTEAASS
jgi:tetratricopeptide (TPR) repeat protein